MEPLDLRQTVDPAHGVKAVNWGPPRGGILLRPDLHESTPQIVTQVSLDLEAARRKPRSVATLSLTDEPKTSKTTVNSRKRAE